MEMWWCFFFKQKTAYEMRISDWSSDVCSSDLGVRLFLCGQRREGKVHGQRLPCLPQGRPRRRDGRPERSEEHTSELQSLMRISYAVFCLKKKTQKPSWVKTNHDSCTNDQTNVQEY